MHPERWKDTGKEPGAIIAFYEATEKAPDETPTVVKSDDLPFIISEILELHPEVLFHDDREQLIISRATQLLLD